MKKLGMLFVAGVVVFAVLQLVRPSIPAQPATAEIQAPPEVRHILEKDCYSCHSDQRRLAWFDEIVPAYWLVRHDILTAREHLNFSTLGSKPAAVQKGTLYEAVTMMQLGAMPLASFRKLHPEAMVTAEDLAALKAYLSPWSTTLPGFTNAPASTTAVSLATVQPELNGLTFDSSFEGWKVISTTDRGDNNTFRFILGNDIAFQAAQSGNITPWPDGARLAKIAWQQQIGNDGLVHPGPFVQVELMIKGAQQYKDSEGWGWGRWRGLDLKPYGKDAHFVGECTSCHLPVRGDDEVYTLPISSANTTRAEILNTAAAALPSGLPYQPLNWRAITMYVDPNTRSTATLYGNDVAMRAVQGRPEVNTASYPNGAVLALVTWAQRDDPHWFGARIPNTPQAIEFVTTSPDQHNSYQRYSGPNLAQDSNRSDSVQRASFILGLPPAQLP